MAPAPDATSANSNKSRRVLSDVSPNVRNMASQRRPTTESPLKRDFKAAMMGDGSGFTYLKKRRLSADETLSDLGTIGPRHERESTSRAQIDQRPLVHDEFTVPEVYQTVPTEPGTPIEFVRNDEDDVNDSSADRRSFSSLINYDPSSQNASQNAAGSRSTAGLLFKGPSFAELLRLRLQVAMYKVRTHQEHVSFNDLDAKIATEQQVQPTEVEDAVAKLREEAYRKQAQAQARSHAHPVAPVLQPAPILRPTKYSSRMIYEPIPSSPPVAMPPARSQFASTTPAGKRAMANDESELTSSIVKGRVAEGLLGLRHAI